MHWVYDYGHHINNTVATEHRATFIQNNCVDINWLFTSKPCDSQSLEYLQLCTICLMAVISYNCSIPTSPIAQALRIDVDYHHTSNIRRTWLGNKIVDHSDVVAASPGGAAPTTSSFST